MPIFDVSLTKTIVVQVEARDMAAAKDEASLSPAYSGDPDGEWAACEPTIEVIGSKEE